MPRSTTTYVCSACGHEAARWGGRCAGCGEWNTLVEEARPVRPVARRAPATAPRRQHRRALSRRSRSVTCRAQEEVRLATGIGELDSVLGGGLVPGSLVLIGGAPGIGKSTLTTMALANLVAGGRRTLYVSAEESAAQIRLRARRLTVGAPLRIPVIAETDLHAVLATLERERPEVCVIDSVQTLHCGELPGAAGSVGQVREVAGEIMRVAKTLRIAVLLVGHVTKEGALAGPTRARAPRRLCAPVRGRARADLPHGTRDQEPLRLDQRGRGVRDARPRAGGGARRLGTVRGRGDARAWQRRAVRDGRLAPVARRGTSARQPFGAGPPRRVLAGLDRNRVALVLAVLGRHAGIGLGAADVFVNVVGGVRADEPGADLAVALAVASAAKGVALTGGADKPVACFGELGLTGELRTVAHGDRRLAEAEKFGLRAGARRLRRTGRLRSALASALGEQRSRSLAVSRAWTRPR